MEKARTPPAIATTGYTDEDAEHRQCRTGFVTLKGPRRCAHCYRPDGPYLRSLFQRRCGGHRRDSQRLGLAISNIRNNHAVAEGNHEIGIGGHIRILRDLSSHPIIRPQKMLRIGTLFRSTVSIGTGQPDGAFTGSEDKIRDWSDFAE